MFGINWMETLILAGAVGVTAVIVTYLVLRLFVWNKAASKSLEHIRKHALWTGIIAWALSNLAGAARAGIYNPDQVQDNPWAAVPWVALIAPVVAVVGVHAVGQASWPAPKSPKRVAVLEFRRVRDFVEPALGWTVLGVFTVSAGAMVFTFFAPGFEVSQRAIPTNNGMPSMFHAGRIPGYVLAVSLTIALTILAAGTALVMRLIASRRSLEALSAEQNKTLRIIGMNRLLRVAATVASGLAAVAGNYLSQPAPGSSTTSWINWLAVVNMAVLIAMLFWKPPVLGENPAETQTLTGGGSSSRLATGAGPAAATLADSAAGAVIPAAIVGGLLGYTLRPWLGVMGVVALSVIFILLTYLALEILLRRNYATPGTPRSTMGVWLPWPLYIFFVVAVLGLAFALVNAHSVAASGGRNTWDGMHTPAAMYWIPGILALVILATGLAAMRFVLVRPGLGNAPPSLDRSLRRRSLFRVARTVTGCWYAILGSLLIMVPMAPDPNPLAPRFEAGMIGLLCLVVAVLVGFYPMRRLGPEDFKPGLPVIHPGNINVGR